MSSRRLARSVAVRATASAGYRLTRLSSRLTRVDATTPTARGLTLTGDRDVEWAWCTGHLRTEPGTVLDFGAGHGLLSLAAAFRGHQVIAVDLEPCTFEFQQRSIEYRQGDLNQMRLEGGSVDQVINCSTIEHVGLAGRYGSPDETDGDLRAMVKLREALRADGDMVLTLPVGRDAVFEPYHRVYGHQRLPELLRGFRVAEETYRSKTDGSRWSEVDRDTALDTAGSAVYYALGLFVLRPE